MKTNLQESLRKIIQQEIAAVLREDSSQFKVGEFVKYTNPASDKKFKKDISFWTNTPKNKNKPFEVYIKDGAIGEIVKVFACGHWLRFVRQKIFTLFHSKPTKILCDLPKDRQAC